LAILGATSSAQNTSSAPTFTVPALTGPVVDNGHMLSGPMQEKLSRFLRKLNEEGGTQLQVLTVDNLGGLSIEEASIKVTDQWKLGTAKGDNGILLMLSRQERRVRIEVGQGYEGDLPDVIASRIVREVIVPQFKQGDIDGGVRAGVLAIVHYVNPKFLEGQNAAPREGRGIPIPFWMIVLIIVTFLFLPRIFRPRFGRRNSWGGWDDWGGGGGFGSGGGGFGGFGGGSSGGGWSGGGGGFSGGGASGGW
jgi:uncharacterized protein